MNRCFQAILMLSTVGLSWLLMMAVHEFGHVLHGLLSGAAVVRVVLPPIGFSRTDFAANPHPLFVAWGGAIWGSLLPPAFWGIVYAAAPRYAYLARWFAGFCLIANGAYLAAGSFFQGREDDPGLILQLGGPRWTLLLFGIPAAALGLYLWNGLGPHFGLGPSGGRVDRRAAVVLAAALIVAVGLESALALIGS